MKKLKTTTEFLVAVASILAGVAKIIALLR